MKIADVIEGLIRKIKKQDDRDIEKEIENLLSDEEVPEEDVPDEEPELESEGGWVQTIDDEDDADDGASLEDEPPKIGEDDEESDDWIQQDDNKTDLQAFGQGGSDATREDALLTELKMDDDLRDQEEHEIMEYLEVVGADELVDEMRSTIAKMKGGKK